MTDIVAAQKIKARLQRVLHEEVDRLSQKTAQELLRELGEPQCWEVEDAGQTFQVEAQVIENEAEYIHVSVGIDDGSLLRSLAPLSTSFLVHADGRVEK